jgi:hypothetical protein
MVGVLSSAAENTPRSPIMMTNNNLNMGTLEYQGANVGLRE